MLKELGSRDGRAMLRSSLAENRMLAVIESRAANSKGHGFGTMSLDRQRRRMIGNNQDAQITYFFLIAEHLSDNVTIKLFNGLYLFFCNAFVSRFIGSFDMKLDYIFVRKRGARGFNFPRIICAQVAGCSVDHADLQACKHTQAANQVDGGNYRSP